MAGPKELANLAAPSSVDFTVPTRPETIGAEAVTDATLRRYPRCMVEVLANSHIALALWLRSVAVANLRRAYQHMTMLGRRIAMENITFLRVGN